MNIQCAKNKISLYQALLLVLFFLVAQYSAASHFHADEDNHYEDCSTCLILNKSDLDDFIDAGQQSHSYLQFEQVDYRKASFGFIENKTLTVQRLRGPPVVTH